MLWRSIPSVVLLVTLGLASPLKKSSVENGSARAISSDSKENEYTLPTNVEPISYVIKLEPHLDGKDFTFDGEVNFRFTLHNFTAMKTIVLHAVDLEIERKFTSLVSIDGRTTLKPTRQSVDTVKERLTIEFADPIETDTYILNLRYTGKLKEDPKGFYRIRRQIDGQDVWEASTQFYPSYASRAFPCYDRSASLSMYDVFIKPPKNYEARSIRGFVVIYDDGDKSWTHFRSAGYEISDSVDFKVVCGANCLRWYGSTTEVALSTTDVALSTTDMALSTTDTAVSTTPEMTPSTSPPMTSPTTLTTIPPTNPPTNQKCVHATYIFTCTQCQPLISISLS